MAVRYGPPSLGGIGIFDPIIQVAGQIYFIRKHCCKLTSYIPLFRANVSTLQLEVGQGGRILEKMPQNWTMVTERLLDAQGMEIHASRS